MITLTLQSPCLITVGLPERQTDMKPADFCPCPGSALFIEAQLGATR